MKCYKSYSAEQFSEVCALLREKRENCTGIHIWEAENLTLEETAAYFGIGQNRLREQTEDETCKFVLYIGSKRLIQRQMFEKYLEQAYSL